MNSMKHIHFPPPVADDMVRALLADRKSVTRRVVKPQPANIMTEDERRYRALSGADPYGFCVGTLDTELLKNAPYHPGDILYVRETWAPYSPRICKKMIYKNVLYKADFYSNSSLIEWHPSIHMPREAARIFLRVTDVRVERLQEITIEDIHAEGWPEYLMPTDDELRKMVEEFVNLWNSTIKTADRALYGWEANPWCWVIAFERISREEAMKSEP